MVAFDDFQLLDLAGPVEVFNTANLVVGEPRAYDITVATPDGGSVRSASGIEIGADIALSRLSRTDLDVLMVVGGLGVDRALRLPRFVDRLRAASRRADLTTSVCTGALALAAAGLLDGYEATTHWASTEHLSASHPDVTVLPDRIHVRDRDRWTSAGVTAGIDLALAIVEEHHGRDVAHAIAGWLVVFAQRPGGQVQFSAQLRAQAATTPSIVDLQHWIADHLDADLTVRALAERAHMSERTFARTFRAEIGTTPAAHVEALRIDESRRLLETTDLTIDAIARTVGIAHGETLHRAFLKRVGTTPARYRQHFARRPA